MKMESHRDVWFAALSKLAQAVQLWICEFVGTGRHWNDEGALRMMFGMRVRGLFWAL
jgi:hypothetical protein